MCDAATDPNPTICLLVVDSGECRQMTALSDNNTRCWRSATKHD
jgi:hypothetical protein